MIRWTTSGAVPSPTTVQIRVQRAYPGRIRAGAPVPTRSMSPDEVAANIRYFTEGHRGPRTRPCDVVVLSGVGVAGREDTPEAIALARGEGVERIVLHTGIEDLESIDVARYRGLVDTLVVPVQPGGGTLAHAARTLAAAVEAGMTVAANTVLSERAIGSLLGAARVLIHAHPHHLTFTYPFPINGGAPGEVPSPPRALAALRPVLRMLDEAGLPASLKGLAACHLGDQAWRLRRSANRWYVDADHQRDDALLFFPDVVSFHKEELCRFCAADHQCDGFFATYLQRPGTPQLTPLEEAPATPST